MVDQRFTYEFVEFIPEAMNGSTLYVSLEYATTAHLCACGCGNKIVLPVSPAQWCVIYDGESVSLHPSVGNWDLPCRSHYWLKGGRVQWDKPWSEKQIQRGRARDQRALDSHFRPDVSQSDSSEGKNIDAFREWLDRSQANRDPLQDS